MGASCTTCDKVDTTDEVKTEADDVYDDNQILNDLNKAELKEIQRDEDGKLEWKYFLQLINFIAKTGSDLSKRLKKISKAERRVLF